MNRRSSSNAVVALAGLLAETNAEADAEAAQLLAALEQRGPVVEAARALAVPIAPGHVPEGGTEPVSSALLARLREALRRCP